jgi:hypothetical protein
MQTMQLDKLRAPPPVTAGRSAQSPDLGSVT